MIVDRQFLADILSAASKVIIAGSGIEIAQALLISASEGKLEVRATNFTDWIKRSCDCTGDMGDVAINAARITSVISSMRFKMVSLEVDGSSLIIKGDRGASRKLTRLPSEAFPKLPEMTGTDIMFDCGRLNDAFAFMAPHMATDTTTKAYLCGLHFHSVAAGVRVAATDARTMAWMDVGGDNAPMGSFTVSAAFLKALSGNMPKAGACTMRINERMVELSWPGGAVRGSVLEGAFPDYTRAIPSRHEGVLLVNANEMVASAKAVRDLGADDKGARSTVLTMQMSEDAAVLVAQSAKGEAVEPMDATWKADEPMNVGIISNNVIAGLSGYGELPIEIRFVDPVSPIVAVANEMTDRMVVMMPCRI